MNSTYFKFDYANGDAPENKDVCTNVVIRPNRKLGIDIQRNSRRYD
ncbi:DUF1287 domain-containing protein [Flavobacterium crocinum]|nr:DUF1287 domain-containing protein [Flavobacterium crocinum]